MTDFPPRLNIPVAQQELLRQEFHRVAVRMGTSQNYFYIMHGMGMSKTCKIHEFFFWSVLFVFKGVKFFHFATECFPLDLLELWCRDGVSKIYCVSGNLFCKYFDSFVFVFVIKFFCLMNIFVCGCILCSL